MKTLSLLLLLLLIPFAAAEKGHMKLLTVGGANMTGGVADVYLEVKPGTGTIFIDSFPLTKLDTQISTRFANEVACDFLDEDCSKYDFFYTIRASASIVGGPSAGAAITVLTISVLGDYELDENTIMTGTINSGGLIGPVAGINEKIDAAIDDGLTKIIIPKWQSTVNITSIEQKNITEKITVVKVTNLEEAVYHFTGEDFSKKDQELVISKNYLDKMEDVSAVLCDRSQDILSNIQKSNDSLYISAEDYLNKSTNADYKKEFYSSASYCFSANIRLRQLEFANKTEAELQNIYENTAVEWDEINNVTNNHYLKTLSDLETYMIVKERLIQAKESLNKIDYDNISSSEVAYAKERLFSGIVWSEFFELEGQTIQMNENHLKSACLEKAAEAEERINYVKLYLPTFVDEPEKEVASAFKYHNEGEYAMCIFKASKAKAEANILLTALTIKDEDSEQFLDEKHDAIKKVIIEQNSKQMFPILGYSYFEFSKSLKEEEPVLSITFAEYALEMSKLDMYFPSEKKVSWNIDPLILQTFIFGFAVGALFVMTLASLKRKNKKTKRKKR